MIQIPGNSLSRSNALLVAEFLASECFESYLPCCLGYKPRRVDFWEGLRANWSLTGSWTRSLNSASLLAVTSKQWDGKC